MLQITPSAAGLLKQVRAANDVPESAALRIQAVETPREGEAEVGFTFTDAPQAEDEAVSEEPDLRVYVAPELSAPLSGAVLDTIETPGGTELQLHVEEQGHHHDHDGHEHH